MRVLYILIYSLVRIYFKLLKISVFQIKNTLFIELKRDESFFMKNSLFFIFVILIPILLFCDKTYDPWYTGTLLSAGADNMEKNKFNIQPTLAFRDTAVVFNKHWGQNIRENVFSFESVMVLQYGILTWLDLSLQGVSYYRKAENQHSFEYGDTYAQFGIQLMSEKKESFQPSIRLTIGESFPTGKYNNLNPDKNGLDRSGSGSYETVLGLNFGKIVYWLKNHPMCFILNLGYTYSRDVKVKNFNTYGGGIGTKGIVKPGYVFSPILGFQFSFTQRWVYAMDFVYVRSGKSKFKGNPGVSQDVFELQTSGQIFFSLIAPEETFAKNGFISSYQFSLAPALEYNFNKNFGVLGGIHFSVKGKNALSFFSALISATYVF